MKAAVVQGPGQAPVYADFDPPALSPGESRITVAASAISPLTRGRASGSHYSAAGRYPFVAGVDGVGRFDDGRRVYFVLPRWPHGGMAEQTVVAPGHWVAIPDALDDVTAAAIANPGMSSWAGLAERARLSPGETVLINGATGTAGRLAVQVARHLGAARVVATGRNREVLAAVGADATIVLGDDPAALDSAVAAAFADGVDVVLDYLWGNSAERLLIAAARAGRDGVPMRFVQVGSASGADITLPGAVLRSAAIELMGSGLGSVAQDRLVAAIGSLLQAAGPAGFTIATRSLPLAEVAQAWAAGDSASRTVLTIG